MASNTPLRNLYEGMKKAEYDVPDNYDEFRSVFTQKGEDGAKERHDLYEGLKESGYTVPSTYEEFYNELYEPVNSEDSKERATPVKIEPQKTEQGEQDIVQSPTNVGQPTITPADFQQAKGKKAETQKVVDNSSFAKAQTPFRANLPKNDTYDVDYWYNWYKDSVAKGQGDAAKLEQSLRDTFEGYAGENGDDPEAGERIRKDLYAKITNAVLQEQFHDITKDYAHQIYYRTLSEGKNPYTMCDEIGNQYYLTDWTKTALPPVVGEKINKLAEAAGVQFIPGKGMANILRDEMTEVAMSTETDLKALRAKNDEIAKNNDALYHESIKGKIRSESPQPYARVESIMPENQELVRSTDMAAATAKITERTQQTLDTVDRYRSGDVDAMGEFARGFQEAIFDWRTWDFGLGDLADAKVVKSVFDKYMADPNSLSKQEMALLSAATINTQAQYYANEYVGVAYGAGKSTGLSLPFMIEYMISGLGGAINAGVKASFKGMTNLAAKEGFGLLKNRITRKVLANLAGEGVNILGSTAMAVTINAPKTYTDYTQRQTASIAGTKYDENTGLLLPTNLDKPTESKATSAAKAIGGATIENASEGWGRYIEPFTDLGKMMSKLGGKVSQIVPKIPKLSKVYGMFDDLISKGEWSSFAKAVKDIRKRAGFNGMFGEYGEEVAGNLANAFTVGDMTLDTNKDTGVFSRKINEETFVSCGVMQVAFGLANAAGYRTPAHRALANEMQANVAGYNAFGVKWSGVKAEIDAAINDADKITDIYKRYHNRWQEDSGYSLAQSRAASNYITNQLAIYGYNLAKTAQSHDLSKPTIDQERQSAYDEGYTSLDKSSRRNAQTEYMAKKDALNYILGSNVEDMTDEDIEKLFADETIPDNVKDATRDYLLAEKKREGALDRVDDEILSKQMASDQAYYDIAQKNEEGQTTGQIVITTMRTEGETEGEGHTVYITSGNLEMETNDKGETILGNEGQVTIYDTETQEAKMVNASELNAPVATLDLEEQMELSRQRIEDEGNKQAARDFTEDAEEGSYSINDEVIINTENGETKATIQNITEDGIEFRTEEPINGKKVHLVSQEEFDNMLVNDETNGTQEQTAEQTPVPDETQTTEETTPEDKVVTTEEQVTIPEADVQQEQIAPKKTSTEQETALSRIPKDEKGEPIYEQTDASTAWDGLIEQTEGDEEMAHEVAEDMVKEKTADLEKAEKEPISQGKTPAEKIAARKAHKAKIEQAKQELEHWKAIANVQAERRAETEQQEVEKVKAEEAKENKASTNSGKSKSTREDNIGKRYHTFKGEEALNKLDPILENESVPRMPDTIEDISTFRRMFVNPIRSIIGEMVRVKDEVFNKIVRNGRESISGAIMPTIEDADFAIKDADGSIIYVKRFGIDNDEEQKIYNVAIVNKHGELEDYVSSVHIKNNNNLRNKIKNGAELLLPIKRTTYGNESQSNSTPTANIDNSSESTKDSVENNSSVENGDKKQKLSPKKREAMESIAKELGYKVVWHDTMEENGYIDYSAKEIHIAEDASNPIEMVFGHESTHAIRNLSNEDFSALHNAMKKLMGEEWWEAKKQKKRQLGYAEEKVDEEVTADAVGMVFNDQKLAKDLARELEGKPNLLARIREVWRKIIEHLKSFGTKEEVEQAENSLAAFEAVVNSFKSAKEKAIERGLTSYMDAAEADVTDGNGIDLNMRTEKDVQAKLRKDLARLKRQKGSKTKWSKEQIDSVVEETESLINLIHSALEGNIRYEEWAKKEPTIKVDWRDGKEKPVVTWSRKNIEYTYDASADLLCINNEGMEATLASPDMVELMLMMGKTPKGFTSEDYMRLYEVMRDLGLNVPCKGCFDAAARLKMLPSVSQEFVNLVNATIDERNKDPEAFDEALRESVRSKTKKGDKTINGLPGKASTKADAVRVGVAGDNLTEHITWTQLMSAEGQTKALSDWGGIFRAWQKTGAGRPKDKLLPEPYNGTYTERSFTIIAPLTEKTPAYDAVKVNIGTGLRRNSHSEFRPILAIDEIQSVRDAYMKGLCMFKYMKELDDVRLFGKMGIKFNMSHFPAFDKNSPVAGLDADGNYISSEESVGSREFTYTDKEGKQHFDGKKGLEEAKKYINEDVSLSSVVFSVPHLIKCLTDVPTHKDLRGLWGSLIPFHSSGATTLQLLHQGLGMARANGVGHAFMDEAFTDYGKGVTNFEDVQNDRFGKGWTIVEGAKAGENVSEGHKLEFANGTHYYNAERGLHLFKSWYVYDNELSEEDRAILADGCKSIKEAKDRTRYKNRLKKSVGHSFVIDYNDKVREIGSEYAYKEAADYYVDLLPKMGLIPRFDFNVPEDNFLQMCADAKVDPHHPKLGWKGEGHSWSPTDSDAYYSLWCDFGMTDPKTGKYSPHRPVGYKEADGSLSFKLPENTVDIVKEGVERYSEQRNLEEKMHNDVMTEYVKRTIADGKLTQEQGDAFLKEHIGRNVDFSMREDVEESNSSISEDLQNRVRAYDESNGTELERFLNFIEHGHTLNEGENPHFKIGKAGDILQHYGIKGDIFASTETENERRHTRNADHGLTPSEWADAMESVNNPLAITSYRNLPNSYRVYTYAIKNGKSICLGMDVKRNGNGVEISNIEEYTDIRTAFGRNIETALSNERILYPEGANAAEQIRRNFAQSSAAHNSQLYEQNSVSTANIDNSSDTTNISYEKVTDTQQMTNYAHDVAEALNVNGDVEVVTSEGLTGKKKQAKGWYDTKTGKITIVADNHTSLADMEQTMLHEAVAHKGLRALFGERFTTFLDNVFTNADADVRQGITDLMSKNNWDARKATEEYLASLAEATNFEEAKKNGVWEKIKEFFRDLLDAVGLSGFSGKITDNELRYILWSSYENLKHGGTSKEMLAQAKDIAKQKELGVGQFAKEDAETENDGILFRGKDNDLPDYEKSMVREQYEKLLSKSGYQVREAMQDSMLSLRRAMEMIYKAHEGKDTFVEDIAGYENPYLGENALSSVNFAETMDKTRRYFKPVLEAINKLTQGHQEARDELTDYMMAKHGLERNVLMAEREAKRQAEEEYKEKIAAAQAKLSKDPNNANLQKNVADLQKAQAKREAKLRKANYDKDYAGLTALTEKAKVSEALQEATKMVIDYEQAHETQDLWEKVNELNEAILLKSYQSGMMNKETYDKIRNMYDYYIPLRGFDEKTGEDVYEYLQSKHSVLNSPIKTAKGRKSKADDPIATMQSMLESAISQGNRNTMVKQRFLNFAENHPSNLISVSDIWLEYDAINDEWKPVFCDTLREDMTPSEIEQELSNWEARMESLQKANPNQYAHGRETANLPYRVVNKEDERQHQVIVKRNGEDKVVTILGNPRLSQAVNGLTNPHNDISGSVGKVLGALQAMNRKLSDWYTTKNPDFIISNFMRDTLYAGLTVHTKESQKYANRFNMNQAKLNPFVMTRLVNKFVNGNLDMNNATEKAFNEFLLNGGETGYQILKSLEDYKASVEKELKKLARRKASPSVAWDLLKQKCENLNRGVELGARFAAYMTSRQNGRSIQRSVWDAKQISVNFNKKGSGGKFLGAKGQTKMGNAAAFMSDFGRTFYVFWNAAVQGTTNAGSVIKRNKGKAFALMASQFLLGVLMASIGAGDDDDKEEGKSYFDLPDYTRRSNIVFKVSGEDYVTIPLPVEYRAVYGLGELLGSVLFNRRDRPSSSELALEVASQFSQLMPLDILEGGGSFTTFVPSAIKPFTEAAMNKSWTGNKIYNDSEFLKNRPEYTKVYKNTNKYLVEASAALNSAAGGDKYTKRGVQINPAQVEYFLTSTFGGYASAVNKLTKMAETVNGSREYDPSNMLLLNRLVKRVQENTQYKDINEEYYRQKEANDILLERLRGYTHDTSYGIEDYGNKMDEIYSSPEYIKAKVFAAYEKNIKKLQDLVESAPTEAEQKEIQKQIYELKSAALDDIETIK